MGCPQIYSVRIPIPSSVGGDGVGTGVDVGVSLLISTFFAVPAAAARLLSFLAAFCAAFLRSPRSRAVMRLGKTVGGLTTSLILFFGASVGPIDDERLGDADDAAEEHDGEYVPEAESDMPSSPALCFSRDFGMSFLRGGCVGEDALTTPWSEEPVVSASETRPAASMERARRSSAFALRTARVARLMRRSCFLFGAERSSSSESGSRSVLALPSCEEMLAPSSASRSEHTAASILPLCDSRMRFMVSSSVR